MSTELLDKSSDPNATMPPMRTKSAEMLKLFAEKEYQHRVFSRGDIISGIIVSSDGEGIWVDIGCKSEGIIPIDDIQRNDGLDLSDLTAGSNVMVCVMGSDKAHGRIYLSVDRARKQRGWAVLEGCVTTGEILEAKALSHNKGGMIVNVEGVQGFIPLSQLVVTRQMSSDTPGGPDLNSVVGQTLRVKVIELDKNSRRVILSEWLAFQQERELRKAQLLVELKEGDIRRGKVMAIKDFGCFVDINGIDGLVPFSELSWEKIENSKDVVKLGEEVEVVVIRIDPENKRVTLSMKRNQEHPWNKAIAAIQPGEMIKGTITRLAPFGAFARIGGIEGLIHISELSDRRLVHPKEVVQVGDEVTLKILDIDAEKKRVRLSLKQASQESGNAFEVVRSLASVEGKEGSETGNG